MLCELLTGTSYDFKEKFSLFALPSCKGLCGIRSLCLLNMFFHIKGVINLDFYKCLKCDSVGEHSFSSYDDGEFGEALWTEYSETLDCDNCNNNETISGTIDVTREIMGIESWSTFIEVEEPLKVKINEGNSSTEKSNINQEIIDKGIQGEKEFNCWLKDNELSYLYIEQSKSTFSTLFKGNVKRPDFLLLLESIGMLAVDVKNYTLY
jgi:hypothetical protein